jgi:hypothetical protein
LTDRLPFWHTASPRGGNHGGPDPVTGEDRLDNLDTIVVFLIAIAQALTMLLTFRRERDIKELRSLVDEQGLRIIELKALLARRNNRQSRPAKSEREPTSLRAKLKEAAPLQPAVASKDLPDTASITENELERTTKVISWLNRVAIDHTAAAVKSTGSR